MDRITVGFDGSEAARAALVWAAAEARLHDVQLAVWTIIDDHPSAPADTAADRAEAVRSVEPQIDELVGDAAEHHVGLGPAAAGLVDACAPTDLLVVGSRGLNPLTSLLLGSVSRACLYTAPCPVAVVRPQPRRAAKPTVIVGIDASAQARHALAVAAEEARLRGAALHAVHAVHWDHLGAELVAPATRQLLAWGKDLVDAELAHTDVAARPVVIPGHPSDVLVRHSARADLLVLGSRGHNPLASLLLGSTSDYCAQRARCPVMIVRSGPA
jgi:nucleotide-binding universal stress UspA family protein